MKHLILAALIGFSVTQVEARGDQQHQEAFRECSEKVGMVKGEKPSIETKQKFRQCLEEKGIKKEKRAKKPQKDKEAFKACHQELGITRPERGEKPQKLDDDTRAKLKQCLESKGVKRPQE